VGSEEDKILIFKYFLFKNELVAKTILKYFNIQSLLNNLLHEMNFTFITDDI
jgi:hypothetical protein